MGEPLAMLPPMRRGIADLNRAITAQHLGEIGMQRRDGVHHIRHARAGTDADGVFANLDVLEILDARKERDLFQIVQPLGHPKPYIRRPADKHGIGMRGVPMGQFVR